jgi:hypothetical protein
MNGDTSGNILFAPAAPAYSLAKRKKDRKRQKEKNSTPKAKNGRKSFDFDDDNTPTKSPPSDFPRSATPPPLPPKGMSEEEEDIWYAKWWMSCFPDSFKNLMPKR